MCSVRKLVALCSLGLLIAGCYDRTAPQTAKLNPTPILEDEAMALRQWEPVRSYYANGSSVAGPVYYVYAPRTDVPAFEGVITDPAIFVGQTVFLPVAMVITPPWQEVTYRGVYTPPTYTAAPAPLNDAHWYEPTYKYPLPKPRER